MDYGPYCNEPHWLLPPFPPWDTLNGPDISEELIVQMVEIASDLLMKLTVTERQWLKGFYCNTKYNFEFQFVSFLSEFACIWCVYVNDWNNIWFQGQRKVVFLVSFTVSVSFLSLVSLFAVCIGGIHHLQKDYVSSGRKWQSWTGRACVFVCVCVLCFALLFKTSGLT